MGGRRSAEVRIEEGTEESNRDFGKEYVIKEWPASTAERWANRAIFGIGKAGVDVKHVVGMGMAGLAVLGFEQIFKIEEPLMLALADEMMGCVLRKVEKAPEGRFLVEDDIEEVATRWRLRMEVFVLHTGFSKAEVTSMLTSALSLAASAITHPTSRKRSRQSSVLAKPRSRSLARRSGRKTSTT